MAAVEIKLALHLLSSSCPQANPIKHGQSVEFTSSQDPSYKSRIQVEESGGIPMYTHIMGTTSGEFDVAVYSL